jgi:deoxyribodipyrimidine photolyase
MMEMTCTGFMHNYMRMYWGKKISFLTAEQQKVVVIIHHSGKRDLYFFQDTDEDEAD